MKAFVSKLLWKARLIPRLLSRTLSAGLSGSRRFTLKRHASYQDYVAKQVAKTTDPDRIEKWKTIEWDSKVRGFIEVFSRLDIPFEGCRALCLGSRTGQEVYALQTLGADAQGIDLVEFPPFTIQGDVHNLRFDSEKFDLVFSNILDHVLYPEKFAEEAQRVLAPGGILVLRAQMGFRGDEYSETFFSSEKPILELFSSLELQSLEKLHSPFDSMDRQFIFRKKKTSDEEVAPAL